ncbi:MAG: T9SS type A sorting domain-containing protein [Crocinitomicaceae bacterium]
MKKLLFFVGTFMALNASAQIYEANDSADFSLWTAYDLDQDGFDFEAFGDVNGMSAVSYSYDNASGAALTPDNLFVSPAIDLTNGSNVMLNFDVRGIDQSWLGENYAIYVVSNTAALLTGTFPTPVKEESNGLGANTVSESIDISAEADGQSSVYIVIRHFQSTNEFAIGFNNLSITGNFASVEEKKLTSVTAYPNPAADVLNISTNEAVASVKVMTMDGKVVIDNNAVNDSFINIDVNDLEAGMYIYEVATAEGEVARDTFMKQ